MRVYRFQGLNDTIQNVVSLYKSGSSDLEIARIIGKSRATISLYLKSAGVPTRRRPQRKFSLNESYFDEINSHESAYWLGFLLADGHLSDRALKCELQERDSHHLNEMAHDLDSNVPVKWSIRTHRKTGKIHRSARLCLSSSKLVASLKSKGWHEFKKSGDCSILRSVSPDFHPSLVRGLFDGDGCAMKDRVSFVDKFEEPVLWFRDATLLAIGKQFKVRKHPKAQAYIIDISGQKRIQHFYEWIYSCPGPRLLRKGKYYLGHPST